MLVVQSRDGKRQSFWWEYDVSEIQMKEVNQCLEWAIEGGLRACVLPLYGAVHFLWPLIFSHRTIINRPLSFLGKASFRTARSATFLGLMIALYQGMFLLSNLSSVPPIDMFFLRVKLAIAVKINCTSYCVVTPNSNRSDL